MARAATARLFVAVDPPAEVSAELVRWAREAVADWRSWSERRPSRPPRVLAADSLHLTLCFLGSRPVAEIAPLGAALDAAVRSVGELSVGAPLWLPPRRAHALAVELGDPAGELAALQRSTEQALAQASGWLPERRRFRAHITLARVRAGSARARSAEILPATPRLTFTPAAILLYRSMPKPEGSTYELLAASALPLA
ncbi:MAG: 2,3-cyclic 3-phosphodiesterase [Solirubrobacteraceae bacterium]|jgi:2'-5' RNA ligase|nr:2,3-cyclic 3-phosphodiesterase [Solirubrobacteraceae bacterium]